MTNRYFVQCGQHSDFVEADTHAEAAAKFWTQWDDTDDVPDANYRNMSTVEVVGKQYWHDVDAALRASGRMV